MPEMRQPPPMRFLLINPSPNWPRVWDNVSQHSTGLRQIDTVSRDNKT
jgi:hypothetical protein